MRDEGVWRRRGAVGRGPCAAAGSGGMGASRPRDPAPPRGSRDDASIVPYTGLQRRRVVVSRLAGRLPRFVGEGHGPPAGPCVATLCRSATMFLPAP